ncbi:MAG: peptidase U35, partial [Proteobacteria bacterium]|nr:peptidase U35 [Pseudomonadota bacterium]MBU1611399.1 peptidase U35 [Pseudomonadota bacterium]
NMGEAARRKLGDIAYAALTGNPTMGDGTVLFHADHGNLGTGGAVSTTTLDELFKLMALQQDLKGKRSLNISPTFFLGPKSVMGTTEQFFKTPLIGGKTNQPNLANIYSGDMLNRVYDSRLDDVSTTAWYLAGRKGRTVKMFFLNGIKTPFQESKYGWTIDGIEHKVRIDAAAVPLTWKALARNAGA